MKKLLIIISVMFLIVSCGENKEEENKEKEGVIKESVEIIDGYIDTLEGSIHDAKDVKVLMEENQKTLKEKLKENYK